MARVGIIGAGFSGLSAASYLAKSGNEVHVFEKNASAGGRARQLETPNGYLFDMGPSWYWMPDVFERFFSDFDQKISSFYELKLLDPSFNLVFGANENLLIPAGYKELHDLFEGIENGSGAQLDKFMNQARLKYEAAMEDLVYKPGLSLMELVNNKTFRGVWQSQLFTSFSRHVRNFFSHPWLIALMEFPILFLGAMPKDTPALYSLMNYAGLVLGNWYPKGGFGSVVDALMKIAASMGVTFHFDSPVEKIQLQNGCATHLVVKGNAIPFDGIIASADYAHVEEKLIPASYRNYDDRYWKRRTFAPSCLIFFVGLNKPIHRLQHHNLFFEEDLLQHAKDIYENPCWPSKPLFYVCNPSKSDNSVAPPGHENLFFLMPIAPGLPDGESEREKYFTLMLERLESFTGEINLLKNIDYKSSYCVSDFIADYHSYNGNAYGLANTLTQTSFLKPKIRNRKIKNLYYTGQLTVPGPGVPPALISGKIAAEQLTKYFKTLKHESVI
jgi:phytoene desaturase